MQLRHFKFTKKGTVGLNVLLPITIFQQNNLQIIIIQIGKAPPIYDKTVSKELGKKENMQTKLLQIQNYKIQINEVHVRKKSTLGTDLHHTKGLR